MKIIVKGHYLMTTFKKNTYCKEISGTSSEKTNVVYET